jgi:hypothetical protein
MIDRGSWAGVSKASREVGQAVEASDLMPLWRALPPLLRGHARLGAGRFGAAYEEFAEARDLARETGADGTLWAASALKDQAAMLGGKEPDNDVSGAREPEILATLAENDGISAMLGGDIPRAAERFAEAVEIRMSLGTSSSLSRALAMRAEALRSSGAGGEASRSLRRARSILRALETPERNQHAILNPLAQI